MDLTIARNQLTRGLQRVQGIVERRTSNAALAHVLLGAHGDVLRMSATDTELTLVADYPATIRAEDDLGVDAQHLFQIARTLPDQDVHLTTTAGGLVTVRSGKSVFNLNTLSADEFPPTPRADRHDGLTVSGAHLRRIIDESSFAISADENRYGLNGAHMEIITEQPPGTAALRMVATDGSRLAYSQVPFEGRLALDRRALVPRKALAELRKLVEVDETPWQLAFGDRSLFARATGVTFIARLVEGEFPDYKQVLPETSVRRAEVDRGALTDAMRRVGLVATDRNHSARFAFSPGALVISADNLDHGTGQEELDILFEGEPFTTGFNLRYFQDLLGPTGGDKIELRMGDVLDPCIVRLSGRDDCMFIVMPLRLD